jgi:flagellar biosynthesis/type III secretory pathway M-ring protein FliF/YscJ
LSSLEPTVSEKDSEMASVDKRLDFLFAKCAAEVDRAKRFVSRLSTDAERLAIEQRNRLLPEDTYLTVQKRAAFIARQDPKRVATIIKGWLTGEH